jgi:pimeloyl-ACP methyl ester carboxylesterase
MPREVVIYVHGLWLTGREAVLLRHRLAREFDFDVHTFRYPSVRSSMSEIVEALRAYVQRLAPATLNLVGHSLGGLVIYRFLERYPEQPEGRVVFLGTPSVSCRAAITAGRMRWAAALMGQCIAEELLVTRERGWRFARSVGVIAGDRSLGLGRLFARFDEPNDGAIAVRETRLAGASEHLTLPVSHSGMLFSARVAHEAGHFLRNGRFGRAPM